MSGSFKRGPALPSGDTPGKKPSKQNRPTSSRKALFQSTVVERSQPQWSEWLFLKIKEVLGKCVQLQSALFTSTSGANNISSLALPSHVS